MRDSGSLHTFEWWSNKWYEGDGKGSDGFDVHRVRGSAHREVPYQREHFHISREGRFGLDHTAVAYVASDFPTASCETMLAFRERSGVTADELVAYFMGKFSPDESGHSHPLAMQLRGGLRLLDIRKPGCPLADALVAAKLFPDSATLRSTFLESREEAAINLSRIVAVAAHTRGAAGILYPSVRTPPGAFVDSGTNLVLFCSDRKVIRPVFEVSDRGEDLWD